MKNSGRIIAIGSLLSGIALFAFLDFKWSQTGQKSSLYETSSKAGSLFSASKGSTSAEAGNERVAKKIVLSHQYFKLRNKIVDMERKIMSLREDINNLEERSDSEFENGSISGNVKQTGKSESRAGLPSAGSADAKRMDLPKALEAAPSLVKKFPVFHSGTETDSASKSKAAFKSAAEQGRKQQEAPKLEDDVKNIVNLKLFDNREDFDNFGAAMMMELEPSRKGIIKDVNIDLRDGPALPPHSHLSGSIGAPASIGASSVATESFSGAHNASRPRAVGRSSAPTTRSSRDRTNAEEPFNRTDRADEEDMRNQAAIHKISGVLFGRHSARETGKPLGTATHEAAASSRRNTAASGSKSLNIAEKKGKEATPTRSGRMSEVFNDPFMFSEMGSLHRKEPVGGDDDSAKAVGNAVKVYCESYADPAAAFKGGKCLFKAKTNYRFARSMGYLTAEASEKTPAVTLHAEDADTADTKSAKQKGSADQPKPVSSSDETSMAKKAAPDARASSKKLEGVIRIEKKLEDSLKNIVSSSGVGESAEKNSIPETDSEVKIYGMPKETASEPKTAETTDSIKNTVKNSMGSIGAQNSYNDAPFGTGSLKDPERADKPMPSLPKPSDMNDEFMDVSAILNKYIQSGSNAVSYDAKLNEFVAGHSEAQNTPAVDSSRAQGSSGHSTTSSDRESEASLGKDRVADATEGPKAITSAAPKRASDNVDPANAVKTGIKLSDILNVHRLFTHEPFKSSRTTRMDNDSSSSSEYSSMSSDYSTTKIGKGPIQPPRPKLPPRPSKSAIKVTIPRQKTGSGSVAEKMPTVTTTDEPTSIKQSGAPERRVSLS